MVITLSIMEIIELLDFCENVMNHPLDIISMIFNMIK